MTAVWFTAAEIAARCLPGLPTSKSKVIDRAAREAWPHRKRAGRGGGREYPINALPKAAREALLDRELAAPASVPAVPPKAVAVGERHTTGLADWQRSCMDARAAILVEVERLAAIGGQKAAIREVIRLAAAGELRADLQSMVPVANARSGRDGSRTLSRATIFRWKAEAAKAGVTALAPREAAPAAEIVPAWGAAFLKIYRRPGNRSLPAILEELADTLPAGTACPSYGQARRFLDNMSILDRERGRHGPNGLLKFKAFRRRSTDGLMPMEIVSADGHCFKADVAHPVHGRPFAPEVCAIIDIATRYVIGWSAGLAESSHVVMDAVRCAVEGFGQFAGFYTDNGSGFVGEMMTADVTGLLGRVGATPVNSIAGRAQSRGKIERLQASLWKRAARSLPTYRGRDMDNEARRRVVKIVEADIKRAGASPLLMSWQEFLTWAGDEVAAYNNRPHSALPKKRDPETGKLRNMSPAEALDAARAQGWEAMMLDDEIVADLFRPQMIRTVQRGEVSLPWGRYFSLALEPFGGDRVRVGYDIHDGSRVWVRTVEDGRLICLAERDGNVVPEMPASKIEHMNRQRMDRRIALQQDKIALIRAEAGPRLLELSAEMPVEAIRYHEELEEAFARRDEPEVVPAVRVSEAGIPLDPDARFAFWLDLDASIATGTLASDRHRQWHQDYQDTSEFRAERDRMEMAAAFERAISTAAAG